MKSITTFALASALAVASTAGANAAESSAPSHDSMSGMMQGPAAGMMDGMAMHGPGEALGGERPLLSLALAHRADLALSAEQESTLRKLVDGFAKEAPLRARDIETAERELAALLKQDPADQAQVDDKVRSIEKLRADLRLRRIQTIAQGRAALTPEQRAKLDHLATAQDRPERSDSTRGTEEMQRFMNSERMPQAMSSMMPMAERMGGGDTMLGMVRMMEMMSMMGGEGMMGGGMTQNPPRSQPRGEDSK